ncbi:MAG: hypothetical protein PQJ46_17405, partial [Spirochaetales bacterium]|nr:hypothetical protein [Spirochaetales bacterium]
MFQAELKQPAARLKGVGPKLSEKLLSLGISTIDDVLKHYPRTYEDRSIVIPLSKVIKTQDATIINTEAKVIEHQFFGQPGKQILKIIIEDNTNIQASLLCFNRNFLANQLIPGRRLLIYGLFQYKFGELQSSTFEFEPLVDDIKESSIYTSDSGDVFKARKSGFGKILPI